MPTDLDAESYTQAQILELIPKLKAKSLQNWIARGVIEIHGARPGRQGKLRWSGKDVIALTFMTEMVEIGIAPLEASMMVAPVIEMLPDFLARFPIPEGRDGYLLDPSADYKAYRIAGGKDGSAWLHRITPGSAFGRLSSFPVVYQVVELDLLFIDCINRVVGHSFEVKP